MAWAGDTSEAVFAFVHPEDSSLWHTATGCTMVLPIDYPQGATSATLAVRGTKYKKDYVVNGDTFTLELPEAADGASEDVYALTLTFDDGTVEEARLGLIMGLSEGGEGYTRCVMDAGEAVWGKAYRHSVLPVSSDVTALSVDGKAVAEGDKGFTGAQGWYALPNLAVGRVVPASMTAGGVTYNASLNIIGNKGFLLFVR